MLSHFYWFAQLNIAPLVSVTLERERGKSAQVNLLPAVLVRPGRWRAKNSSLVHDSTADNRGMD